MNVAHQYRPAYFSGVENLDVPFDTIDELLAIPFVANFAKNPTFYRFSVLNEDGGWNGWNGRAYPPKTTLMAEFEDGKVWRVVAFCDERVNLPEWHPPAHE